MTCGAIVATFERTMTLRVAELQSYRVAGWQSGRVAGLGEDDYEITIKCRRLRVLGD